MPTLPESPSPDTNKKAADASPSQGWRGWVRGHRAWLLLTLGLMLAVTLMVLTQPLPRVDRLLQDNARASMTRPASDEIVIVAIDDKTLATIGRYPWRRALHAEAVRRIAVQAPRCIGLDILMPEPDNDHPGDDATLADAMLDSGCVVLPMALQQTPDLQRELLPVPALAAAATGIGHAHLSVDEDGVVRSAYLREGFPGRPWPHFAVALWDAANARPQRMPVPATVDLGVAGAVAESAAGWRRSDHELIIFASGEHPYRMISYIDVLRGAVPADVFRNRIVIIGATADGLGDLYGTPALRSGGLVPGAEIFASILQAQLEGRHLVVAQPWQDLVFNLGPLLVALLGLLWLRPFGAIALICAMLALRLGLHIARPSIGVQFAPAAGFAGLLLVYPLWSLLRLTAAIRYLSWGTAQLRLGLDELATPQPPSNAGDFLDRQMAVTAAAARHMRDLHRFVRDGLNSLPDAALVLDARGKVLVANLAAQQRWQPDSAKLLEHDGYGLLADICWRDTGVPMLPPLTLGNSVEPIIGEGVDAKGRSLLMRCVPLFGADNQRAGWMVVLVDVTLMRRTQIQRDEALRFISHDIREPSAAVLTIVELARTHPEAISFSQLLARVERHARSGLNLADGFVNLARAEAQLFRTEVLDLVAMTQESMDDQWAAARARKVRLVLGQAPEEALCIADRSLIARALSNIASNAVKYSPHGAQVDCSITQRDGNWCVTVRDQGPGIATELQSSLFQPFQRLHRDSHPDVHGVGLGLLLVRTVAQRHGGSVEIESAAGAGCAVTLLLPQPTEAEIAIMNAQKE